MTRIDTLKLMGFTEEEAIEKATTETAARIAFRRTSVTTSPKSIEVTPRRVGDVDETGLVTVSLNWSIGDHWS